MKKNKQAKHYALAITGIVAVVAVVALVMMFSGANKITGMAAGGQGKAQGNSCMSQCMGINAVSYSVANELTQQCQVECNVGTGAGSCLTSADGCCVPFTGDVDCGALEYPNCMDYANQGSCCILDSADTNACISAGGKDSVDIIGVCPLVDLGGKLTRSICLELNLPTGAECMHGFQCANPTPSGNCPGTCP